MNKELCVPASAISLAGENNEDVAPEPGDQVSLTIEGKVARVEGGNAYITPETCNGEAMAADEQEPALPPNPEALPSDDDMAGLRQEMGAL
jgi:hypothetical protein